MKTGTARGPVLVMGAGAIGCFLGGRLQAAGAEVIFVGRPRVLDALAAHGLRLTDLEGPATQLPAAQLHLAHSLPPGLRPALVLLCVKSGATAEAAQALAEALPTGTLVLSMQNGLSNAAVATQAAPGLELLPGMVPFNVSALAPGHFHRGTTGALAAQDHPALRAWAGLFAASGLPLQLHRDMQTVQWAKLLLNLNNPVNALSGLPLRAQLLDRDLRCVLAALQQETLALLEGAGITPARLTPLPPQRLPGVLRLPTWLFRAVAARMLRIDDHARSSMADDLARGVPTEIDALCGEVVRLAERLGRTAPLNAQMAALVRQWPSAPRAWRGQELRQALGLR